ncbi:hypothetical protein protein [Babesia ovis]|uniref:J domain-containing protein n=1 Tax=Babesia ovis TaxID=5869 RepID=A0A9W5WVK4_BABOV|nr:hypothetical protein protein [Babesia ovis]
MESAPRKRQNAATNKAPKQIKQTKANKKVPFNLVRFLRDNCVVIILGAVLVLGIVLKYFEDSYHSMQNFTEFGDDIYAIMGVSKSATDAEIKAKYRQLNHKWHPDKNPNCADCKEKFMKLKAAYKILSNPELKKLYDTTNGRTVNMISSVATELTPTNYDQLVRGSTDLWVVQLYSDDSPECQYFAKTWEEAVSKLGSFANFGRVNELLNPKAVNKLPIKAQLLPAVMMIFPGGGYDLFPQDALKTFQKFNEYFMSVYPNSVINCRDHDEFRKNVAHEPSRPALLFRTTSPGIPVPIALMHVAMKYQWAFDTYWLSSTTPMHSDKELMAELMQLSHGDNNMIGTVAIYQMMDDVDAVALFYGAHGGQLISCTAYRRKEIDVLHRNLDSILTMAYPPLEISRETFGTLCKGTAARSDRFCIIVTGNAHETFQEETVLKKLGHFDISNRIGSIYAKPSDDPEAAAPPTMAADVQLVRLPTSRATPRILDTLVNAVVLLDAGRGKFCTIASTSGLYDCGLQEDTEYAWVSDIAEGAYDTLSWYDVTKAFGGNFEDQCINASKPWYKLF